MRGANSITMKGNLQGGKEPSGRRAVRARVEEKIDVTSKSKMASAKNRGMRDSGH